MFATAAQLYIYVLPGIPVLKKETTFDTNNDAVERERDEPRRTRYEEG